MVLPFRSLESFATAATPARSGVVRRAARLILVLLVIALLLLLALATPPLVIAAPAAGNGAAVLVRPPARYSAGAAFDSDRGVLVVFGGWTGAPLGDTWEWNGTTWRLAAATGPQPRNAPALAYDPVRRKTVLFGGDSDHLTRGDTWEWNGSTWTRLPVSGPASRTLHRLAFMPSRGRVLLFGGMTGGTTIFGDLWEWSGTAWTRLAAEGPARFLFGMTVHDSSRLVVFGGNTSPASPFGNESGGTWRWSSGVWDSVPDPGPGARDHVAIAYDASRRRTVLYGGFSGSVLADLWEFDGERWTNVPFVGGPGPRSFPQLVYDNVNRVVLLFGGFDDAGPKNDLWAWNGTHWRRVDDEMVATLLQRFDVEAIEGALRVRWELSERPAGITLERARAANVAWTEVARLDEGALQRGEILDRAAAASDPWSYRLLVRSANGTAMVAGVARWPGAVANREIVLELLSANPTTSLLVASFDLPSAGHARLALVDLQGRAVATLLDRPMNAGRHRASWDARAAAPGVYFLRLDAAGETSARRCVIAR